MNYRERREKVFSQMEDKSVLVLNSSLLLVTACEDKVSTENCTQHYKCPKHLIAILLEKELQLTLGLYHNISLGSLTFVCHSFLFLDYYYISKFNLQKYNKKFELHNILPKKYITFDILLFYYEKKCIFAHILQGFSKKH